MEDVYLVSDFISCHHPHCLVSCKYKKLPTWVVDDDTNPKEIAPKLIKMSYYIPFEIQAEIIKRLPVKSLIQFTSVSKQWKSLIYSSKFITDYKAFLPQHCLLVTCTDENFKKKLVLIVDDDHSFHLHNRSHTIPSSVNLFKEHICTFGSSQGLFCFYGYMDGDLMAVIWNPSIRKSVDIVVSSKYDWSMYNATVGLGVCPSTSDVKLVKIITYNDDDTFYDDLTYYTPTQVEVLTLSSGTWKSLSINLPRESIRFTQDYSMDLDGFIYWLAIDEDDAESEFDEEGETGLNMIMSFDMRSENFIEIPLPHILVDGHKYTHLSISKWMESLVVLEYNLSGPRVHNVWILEDGVKKSFTKLFTIEAPEARIIRRVLGFRKSGEPIITMKNESENENPYYPAPDELGVLYHCESNSKHIIYIRISTDCRDSHLASSYTDTLLLLDQ